MRGGGVGVIDASQACRDYAQTAVYQNTQNLRQRCGYRGGAWKSNYRSHLTWCRRARNFQRTTQTYNRQLGLALCRMKGPACRNYVRTAINQNYQNRRQRCGYRGRRWHPNQQSHFSYCLRASVGQRNAETRARSRALGRCAGRPLYRSRWVKIGGPGGAWSSGWARNQTAPVCHQRSTTCICMGRNFCGRYTNLQTTFWWPRGCRGPRWLIQCMSEPQ